MNTPSAKLLSTTAAARLLGVPARWLRAEADEGRIPHLQAGARILVNLKTVERILSARATKERKEPREL